MKRRDFIRTAVAIVAAVPNGEAKLAALPDRSGIKWENTWARWGEKPGSRTGECFAWGMKATREATTARI